jgi:hypothetical protein
MIEAGSNILKPDIHNFLILFGIRKNYRSSGRTLSFYPFTKMAIKLIS